MIRTLLGAFTVLAFMIIAAWSATTIDQFAQHRAERVAKIEGTRF